MSYFLRKNRVELRQNAYGILTETFPLAASANSTTMTSQTAYFGLVGFVKGDVITNIHFSVLTQGTGTTNFFVGIYDTAGNRLAVSNDLTNIDSGIMNMKTAPLSAPYTITQDGGYYLALLAVSPSPAVLLRGQGQIAGLVGVGSGARLAAAQTGQTTLPTTATFANTSTGYWMAAS